MLETQNSQCLNSFVCLSGNSSSVVIHAEPNESPSILYWGEKLNDEVSVAAIARLRKRHLGGGVADVDIPITLFCESGIGFMGSPGFAAHRDGQSWSPVFLVVSKTVELNHALIVCRDINLGISVEFKITLDKETDIATIESSFKNDDDTALVINCASTCSIPIESDLNEIIHFTGRWANEFQTNRHKLEQSKFVIENRRGRTSHDKFPGIILCTSTTTESSGHCLGAHLGWSGNHRTSVDACIDNRRVLQMGELLLPGEIRLQNNEVYTTPKQYLGFSANGLGQLSKSFHTFYNKQLCNESIRNSVRPVHYNTWEAIYFQHCPQKLIALANKAAEIGVERFVMDDGWFLGRQDDSSGLGDWLVDPDTYPNGLRPIIDHCKSLDMEFGLWVEPEMVNVDSQLYKYHPDWILGGDPERQVPFRNQFVLDLSNSEVSENLYMQLDRLLTEHDIAYLKWDMNRDINHAEKIDGRAATHRQTLAFYALLKRLRNKHPLVEIESCSSGGARIDYGVLQYTDRVWTSDSNDAIDRQKIQRGASYFFPLSILGSHVGPAKCKITHRVVPMSLRCTSAIFGSMGVEANLMNMSQEDQEELSDAIELYKKHRHVIHNGEMMRFDETANQNVIGIVSDDRRTGLFSCVQMASDSHELPRVLRPKGLAANKQYRIKIVWPTIERFPLDTHHKAVGATGDEYFSGDLLMKIGIQLPLLYPQMSLVYELSADSTANAAT